MSFQPPSSKQEQQNRKILEDLQQQKKQLMMKHPISAGTSTAPVPTSNNTPVETNQAMTSAQRAALQHAHANSNAYFITQDSSFGNLILPVIPRLNPN